MTSMMERVRSHIHPVVFPVSAGVIIAFVIFGAGWSGTEEEPGAARDVLIGTRDWITANLGWFMILAVAVFLIFCLFLAFSRFGRIRLGPDDSRPDYSTLTWFAMLFSAGMGIGLMFWGVAEPVSHYLFAPRVEPETVEAAREAMLLSYHHWGLLPWAVYAVLGLSLAYFGFRHNLPMTIRSALYPLIGDRIHGWMGNTVDVLAIFGTMFGVATSLGLGVLQINAGMSQVFGSPQTVGVQILLIAIITGIATVSVFTGLDKGIRRLSQLNITLAAALLAFVALVGPTVLLVSSYVENLGAYLFNFIDILGWSGAYSAEDSQFLADWTVFYWAWWISWAPFVGMFIARISRGRTIREFVFGVLIVPTLVSYLWFTVFGNTALDIELNEETAGSIGGPLTDGGFFPENALFAMLDQLPLAGLVSTIAIVLIMTFFVTSSDSGSFVIDMIASGGDLDPPRGQRIFWALTEGFVAAVLLAAGGLDALQAGAVSTGLPFTFVLLIVVVGLLKGLRGETVGLRLESLPQQPTFATVEDMSDAPEATHPEERVTTTTGPDEPPRTPERPGAGQ